MRRMIPQKQIEVLNKIQDSGDLPGVIVDDAVLISGTAAESEAVVAGNETLNLAADKTLIPADPGNAAIYLSGGEGPYIDVWVDGELATEFGRRVDEDGHYSVTYSGMPDLYSAKAECSVEFYVRDQNDNEIVISHSDAMHPDNPATLKYNVITGHFDDYGVLYGRGVYLRISGYVKASLVAQLNTLQPTNLYVRIVGNPFDEYAFKGINVDVGKNVFKWDSNEECLVLEGTWQQLSAQYMEPVISGKLQADFADIGWYNS